MPIHKIEQSDTSVTVWRDSVTFLQVIYADLVGKDNPAKATDLQDRLQDFFDVRIKRSELSGDDPDKSVDLNQEKIFWDGGDLVSRPVIFSIVWLDIETRPTIQITKTTDKAKV